MIHKDKIQSVINKIKKNTSKNTSKSLATADKNKIKEL